MPLPFACSKLSGICCVATTFNEFAASAAVDVVVREVDSLDYLSLLHLDFSHVTATHNTHRQSFSPTK